MNSLTQSFHRQNAEGGIGGGYTGATQGQIDALKVEIAQLDAEIAEWPEAGMEERRARLSEKLSAMEADLAASGSVISSEFAALMARLRISAAAGITIPLKTTGAALPQPPGRALPAFAGGGWVHGAGTGTSDSVLSWLSDGEFVVNSDSAGRFGGLLEAVNAGYPADKLVGAVNAERSGAARMPPVVNLAATINLTANGVQDPEEFARQVAPLVERQLANEAREAFSGIFTDTEFAG